MLAFDEVDYEISGIPFTSVLINYRLFSEADNSTKVQFSLKVQSTGIGKSLLVKMLLKAQDQLMIAMQNEMKNIGREQSNSEQLTPDQIT